MERKPRMKPQVPRYVLVPGRVHRVELEKVERGRIWKHEYFTVR